MKVINMGMNREPAWVNAEDELKKWGWHHTMTTILKDHLNTSLELRNQIMKTVESEGVCLLSWTPIRRATNDLCVKRWSEAMPEYKFKIEEDYKCIVSK